MRQIYLIIAGLFFIGVCITMRAIGAAPAHGWSTPCRIVSTIDGDTIDVEVKRTIRVRLLDAWAPESRTTNADEKKRGLASKEHLRAMAEGCDATLFVPAGPDGDVKDLTTLGRVLGQVWLVRSDGTSEAESLAEMQVKAGHATRVKAERVNVSDMGAVK